MCLLILLYWVVLLCLILLLFLSAIAYASVCCISLCVWRCYTVSCSFSFHLHIWGSIRSGMKGRTSREDLFLSCDGGHCQFGTVLYSLLEVLLDHPDSMYLGCEAKWGSAPDYKFLGDFFFFLLCLWLTFKTSNFPCIILDSPLYWRYIEGIALWGPSLREIISNWMPYIRQVIWGSENLGSVGSVNASEKQTSELLSPQVSTST